MGARDEVTTSIPQPARLRLPSADVVHDVIDDQVVVVRLDTGVYYGLEGVASLAWAWLERGASLEQLHAFLRQRFPEADIDGSLTAFVDQLQAEGLLAPDDDVAGAGTVDAVGALTRAAVPAAFVAPRLEKYTDMQELLLIDPVHETDERGWPHPGGDRASG
jgi:hypothetical protein